MKSLKRLLLGGLFLAQTTLFAEEAMFLITDLPKGKSVTLPRPATTYVPLTHRVELKSTDLPQTIKFSAVSLNGGKVDPFELAIYDEETNKIQHVKIDSTNTALYTFKSLSAIRVTPVLRGIKSAANTNLKLESTKPLYLSH
ncbi:MAG: hypothetical protein AB7T49_11620 [Oligoflexales bacterium]